MKNCPYFLFLFPLLLLIACNQNPKQVQQVLSIAGNNRTELEKVIAYYRTQGERDKLKAAYFLIGNMSEKYGLDGDVVRSFDVLFDIMDSLRLGQTLLSHQQKLYIVAFWV
jgi:hypothetical protein